MSLQGVSVVRRRLDTLIYALRDISLELPYGLWLGIIGPNGGGKSTFARVVAGLSKVSSGQVVRRERLHHGQGAHVKRSKHTSSTDTEPLPQSEGTTPAPQIRVVMQNPDAQIVGQTVYEDLIFGMENVCIPPEEMPDRAKHALAEVGLSVPFDTPIERLSGGQKQLLCTAAALVTDPDCIVFDEPTAMLDPFARQRLLTTAARLHKSGLTVVWISQFTEELVYADEVMALQEGQIAFRGTPREFFYESCLSLGYLPPYPVQVALALEKRGLSLSNRPTTPDELGAALGAMQR
ncbi:hypothetical protein AN477_14905 [Alicyclobacillus ferrooxydans]|uniref:ABC transporter domain-containing protein n=1 Tax=Alicyclobacillus ferrooxydans TaxID=471514 RepID=A0A0P9GQB7_9BACL|nr:hypothetical protein AN477_14905 [Alicyclobacillus ferrooxydans]